MRMESILLTRLSQASHFNGSNVCLYEWKKKEITKNGQDK